MEIPTFSFAIFLGNCLGTTNGLSFSEVREETYMCSFTLQNCFFEAPNSS